MTGLYIIVSITTVILVVGIIAIWLGFKQQIRELRESQKNDPAMALMSQWLQETRSSVDGRLQETRQVLDSRLSDVDTKLGRSMDSVAQKLDRSIDSVSQRLEGNTKAMSERLDNAARVIGDVQKQLGTLSKATENIQDIGRDISSLQDILRAPKMRGGLGEYFLADLLEQIIPQNYELQYQFASGEKVDAAVRMSHGLVPIDAKFPLENFKKMIGEADEAGKKAFRRKFYSDVRKHIDDIATKYILPDQGTFNFALMYIPAENLYYEIIIRDESFGDEKALFSYALERHVIPVSPNTLYAYLQAIILGLRGLRVEERAQEIIAALNQLTGDLARFREEFDTLGGHIGNAAKKYDEAGKRLVRFEGQLEHAAGKQPEQIKQPDA